MPTILSSRTLKSNQKERLLNAGIGLVEYDALEIQFETLKINTSIENAIITSQNTVKAILENKVEINNCFCVGVKTAKLLTEHNYKVMAMEAYGKDLGILIVKKYGNRKFTFFCGSKRRHEMPDLLAQHKVEYREIQVYKNKLNPKKFSRKFDGIMFFSPSQIKSYITYNNLENQKAFCIGTTTATEAKKYTNQIITANTPTVESVIVQVVKTLKND